MNHRWHRLPPFVLAAWLLASSPAARAETCEAGIGFAIVVSPERPNAGHPVRVLVAASDDSTGRTLSGASVHLGAGAKADVVVRRHGPPESLAATFERAPSGSFQVHIVAGGRTIACHAVSSTRRAPGAAAPGAWATTRAWDRDTEALYAAWIEALFDAPADAPFSFPSLAPIIQDPRRNLLHNHLGLNEDTATTRGIPKAEPDCADLPYFLRATFAWKLGLPMGLRDCSRGTPNTPPRCGAFITNEDPPLPSPRKSQPRTPLSGFRDFMRRLANTAHSGSARTALGDDNTDYYPVPLTRAALRPGTIYADPYGHVLMVVKWLPQTPDRAGLLLAVDGQPDNSISRKRFWEGTFLFAKGLPGAGPGFKRARPLIGQPPVSQPNAALTKTSAFAPYANDQGALDPETFYARIGKLINPRGLPPAAVYEETLNALVEQLNTRLASVDTGEAFVRSHPGTVIPMPEGAKIFETIGPWEDFATPSRDMRLLIAMNVLLSLPERIVRHPDLFVLAGKSPAAARTEIEALHQRLTRERTLDYKRSDLSLARITIADLLARRAAFEIAYNPNDCVERRWGAPENSPEISTCQRRAPEDQRTRMNDVRTWFRTTQRPPR